jgi:hypothetical protein
MAQSKLEYSSELDINSPETFNFNPWLQTAFVKLIFVSPQVSNSTLESKHGWVLKNWMFLMLFTVELELSCLTDFD